MERLEDRSLLAVLADVVFLVDESSSAESYALAQQLSDVLGGTSGVDAALAASDIDVRYGMVGYGSSIEQDHFNGAHSHLLDGALLTAGDHLALIQAELNQEVGFGSQEDGWDAIEHAIAEYPLRDGAVPVFVLVQHGSGREHLNTTLVRDGVLRAMESKNVILNSRYTHAASGRLPRLPTAAQSTGLDGLDVVLAV
jgi:hypothetical protein